MGVNVGSLKHLQTLPDTLHGNGNVIGERYGNATNGIEGAELDELILCLARHVDNQGCVY